MPMLGHTLSFATNLGRHGRPHVSEVGALSRNTPLAYQRGGAAMLTIVESPLFSKLWPDYWTFPRTS